jgi:hypothetical protein
VLQRPSLDADRLVISDLRDFAPVDGPFVGGGDAFGDPEQQQQQHQHRHHHENIFKSLSDRLDALEKAHTRHALLLQAAVQRFELQLDQILAELDFTDRAARSLESYRDRLQRYLVEYVEERMDRVEAHVERARGATAGTAAGSMAAAALSIANALLLVVLLLALLWSTKPAAAGAARPAAAASSPPVSPLRDQAVPSKPGDSLDRVEQTLMEASPLLLFDPETDLVDGIYQASPLAGPLGGAPAKSPGPARLGLGPARTLPSSGSAEEQQPPRSASLDMGRALAGSG